MPKKMSKKTSKKVVAKKVKVIKKANSKRIATKRTSASETKTVKTVKAAKAVVVSKPMNRTQIIRHLVETSGMQKKDVLIVMNALVDLMEAHLKKRGPGEFTLLGLAKFRVVHKSAAKARQGINPFTGESTMFAAKPARNVVKVKPLKRIKEMVA